VVLVLVPVSVLIVILTLALVVPGPVTWLVFGRPDEIDGPIACVIFVAVLAPMLRVSGRYIEVYRLQDDPFDGRLND